MKLLVAILMGLLTAATAVAREAAPSVPAPLGEASAAAEKRQYPLAISKAMAVAAAADEKPELRGKAFELAAQCYLEIGCPQLAIATYNQALVALGSQSPHAVAAWWRIAQVHIGRLDYQAAIAQLEKATTELDLAKVPKDAAIHILDDLAACRELTGQTKAALTTYETLFSLVKEGDLLAAPLARAARLYAEFQRFDKAIACLDRLYGKLEREAVITQAAKAYQELAQKLPAVGRTEDADAVDRKIISVFARREPSAARAALLRRFGGEDDAAVLKVVGSLREEELRLLASDEVLDAVLPAALRLGRADEIVRHLTRAMLGEPFEDALVYACSRAIATLRLREGRLDDALAAAYACYAASGFGSYGAQAAFGRAVDLVADTLRARDGHLVSGNAFRLYQVHGPAGPDRKLGTPDDLANPLANLAPKPDPERDRIFEAALAARPSNAAGHRARGWLCLVWGKPRNALGEFKKAFALCSLESTALARAAQDVALGLKALNATPVGMEAFAEFQRLGANGPDGKPNTADDLKDPLAGL